MDREPLALACALLSARASGLDAADPDDEAGITDAAGRDLPAPRLR